MTHNKVPIFFNRVINLNYNFFFRFRHPLTVPDMPSFVAPNPYGFSGSYYGTPERYEMNRYAYRLGNKEPEPEAAALKAPSQEEAELQQVIFLKLLGICSLGGVPKLCT